MPNLRMANASKTNGPQKPCGIIRTAALWTLCRYRHKTHWTGHKSRLDRPEHKRWGDDAYAFEELVAELGAAFGCALLGLVPQVREDHAPYIAGWLRQLKADPRALVSAAAKASTAIDFLNAYSITEQVKEAA